jgi:hypothetical protein
MHFYCCNLQFPLQKRRAGDPLKISRKELVATDDLSASYLLTVVNVYQEGIFDVEDINATVEDSKTSRNMCEDLLGYTHKQAK